MTDFVLLTSPDAFKAPVLTPYCLAAEAALRMGHVEFSKEVDVTRGVVPRMKGSRVGTGKEGFQGVLRDAVLVSRSAFSREEARLTEEQKVVRNAFVALCEAEIQPIFEWVVAGTDAALARSRVEYRKQYSMFRRYVLPNSEGQLKAMHSATKSLTEEDVAKVLDKVCGALEDQLGNNPWLLGTGAPTVVDAVVFGFVGSLVYPCGTASRACTEHIQSNYSRLVEYLEATRQRYFEVYSLSFFLRRAVTDDSEPAPAPSSNWCSASCCLATAASTAYFLTMNLEHVAALLDLEE